MAKRTKPKRPKHWLSEDQIRLALISHAADYCAAAGVSKTALSKAATGDPSFFSQVEEGRNFTIGMYQRAKSYIDDNPPRRQRSG